MPWKQAVANFLKANNDSVHYHQPMWAGSQKEKRELVDLISQFLRLNEAVEKQGWDLAPTHIIVGWSNTREKVLGLLKHVED